MQALSPTDSAFLWMETRNQPMHVAGLNLYTPPPDAPSDFAARLVQRWREQARAEAPFHLRPVLRMGLWYWEEDTDFEVDYHLRHVALPQPGRIRELLAMVSRVHGNLLDRNRPLWEAYVIEGLPGGRIATYTKVHHALIDGVSGARLMARSLSTHPEEPRGPFWAQVPAQRAPRSSAQPARLRDQVVGLVNSGRHIFPGVSSGLRDMLALGDGGGDALARPFQAPPTPFNVQITGSRRFAAQSYALSRLRRIGQAAGATVNDVTLAICAGALRSHLQAQDALPSKPLVAMVPVSLHGESGSEAPAGNQVTLLLASLATDVADPLQRLQRIVQSTRQAKDRFSTMHRLQKMAHGMTTISPMGLGMVSGLAERHPVFNVVISNVPGPTETLYMDGARLDEVYPVSVVTHYLALNITISGYRDQLGFGFVACRRSVPHLQRMLDYTDIAIAELESALGLTEVPSMAPRKTRSVKKASPRRTPKTT